MLNIYRDTNLRRLTELLSELAQSDIALPDFQRSNVWVSPLVKPDRTSPNR